MFIAASSALAAGDASARRAVAACDDLLAVLVSAMQPRAPATAAPAPAPAPAPTEAVAADAVVAVVASVETSDGGEQDGSVGFVTDADAVVTGAVVADDASTMGDALTSVVEGSADVAAEPTAPPPSYSSTPPPVAPVPVEPATIDMVAAEAAALTIAALASLDELREPIAQADGLIASIVALLRLGEASSAA